jgi:hypothetical protein
MRYYAVPTISFVDINGVTRSVKDLRTIPEYITRGSKKRIATEPMDYTAQLADVYGPDAEGLAYLLWEANAVAIVESNFDLTTLQTLTVPVPQ